VVVVDSADEGFGRLAWEVLETATGQVRRGARDLRLVDFEVMVTPPPVTPRFDLLGRGPRRVAAEVVGWLVRAGRGSTTKAVRLGGGFWLVLRELLTPSPLSRVVLSARHDDVRLSCLEVFTVDEGATTATKVEEPGSLLLEWAPNQDGSTELLSTTFVTDVSLRLRAATGPRRREPVWRVKVLAGSVVRWPQSADGLRLAPRLRPGTYGRVRRATAPTDVRPDDAGR
jgi:hypothetical protein